jgi:hypothetical protein
VTRLSGHARFGVIATLLVVAACSTKDARPNADGGVPGGAAASAANGSPRETPAITAWDDSLGGTLAIMSMDRGVPVIFVRDTTTTSARAVALYSHDATLQAGTLAPGAPLRGCARERSATVETPAAPGLPAWSLALEPGVATPLAIDGLDDLVPRDSTAALVRLRRVVGTLPEDSTTQLFRGLPIVVRDAWRVTIADATPVWIGIATRTLGTESNPRIELVTFIAEAESTGSDALRMAWWQRESGPEDRLVGADLLAAFSLRGARPVLAMSRASDRGDQLDFIDRVGPGSWRLRWSSRALGCDPAVAR